jgi:prephenate dehydrogenase
VEALGAQPYFLDPLEHDGLTAAVEHLPALLAAALATATAGSPSWGDMRKLAGSQFYSTTLTIEEGAALAAALVENRQHVTRRLDALLAVLDSWHQHLDAADVAGLAGEIERGATAGREWLTAYRRGTWDADPTAPEMPTTGSMMRSLWGLGRRQMPEPPKRR